MQIRDHHQRAVDHLAEKGNEPSRAAFEGAFVAYSHVPDLDSLLQRVPVYLAAGHDKRIRAFYSMAFIQHWFIHEAERHCIVRECPGVPGLGS